MASTRRKQAISRQLNVWNSKEPKLIEFVSLATETQDVIEEKTLFEHIQLVTGIIQKIRDNSEYQAGEFPPGELTTFVAYLAEKKVEDTLKELSKALKTLEDISSSLNTRGNVKRITADDTVADAFDLFDDDEADLSLQPTHAEVPNNTDNTHAPTHGAEVRETTHATATMRTRSSTRMNQAPTLNPVTEPNNIIIGQVRNTHATRERPEVPSFDEDDFFGMPTSNNIQTHTTLDHSLRSVHEQHDTHVTRNNEERHYPAQTRGSINIDDFSESDLNRLVGMLNQRMERINPSIGEVQHNAPNPRTLTTRNHQQGMPPANQAMNNYPTRYNQGVPLADQTHVPYRVPLRDITNNNFNMPVNNRVIVPDNPATCPIPWNMAHNEEGINVFNRFNGNEARQRCEQLRLTSRRLTEAEIDNFTGAPEKFRNFWLSYRDTMAIDCLTDSARFECLKRKCSGAARSLIDGYPVTSEGFEQAVTALFEHYNDDEVVAHAALTKLAKLTRISHDYSDLENKFGEIRAIVIELTARGQADNIAMQNLILDKFPEDIKTELGNSRTHYEIWNTTQMMSCLAKIVRSRAHNQRLRTLRYEADAAVIPCIFCNSMGHRPSTCKQLVGSQENWKRIITHRRCLICIETGHETANCPNGCCTKCGSYHNSVFCNSFMEGMKAKPENSVTPNKAPASQGTYFTHSQNIPWQNKPVFFQSALAPGQTQFGSHNPVQNTPQGYQPQVQTDSGDKPTLNPNLSGPTVISTTPKPVPTLGNTPKGVIRPVKFIRYQLRAPQPVLMVNDQHVYKPTEGEYVDHAHTSDYSDAFNPAPFRREYYPNHPTTNSEDCGQNFFRAELEQVIHGSEGNIMYQGFEHESDPESDGKGQYYAC